MIMSDSEDRTMAITSYNRVKVLLKAQRSFTEDQELLQAAITSRRHWLLVGGEKEFAIADWLMSRVYVQLSQPVLAVEFAIGALAHNQINFPAWLKASLFEGAARAYKSEGNNAQVERYKALAYSELVNESGVEHYKIISDQIAEI
jgi:hypothetical protein